MESNEIKIAVDNFVKFKLSQTTPITAPADPQQELNYVTIGNGSPLFSKDLSGTQLTSIILHSPDPEKINSIILDSLKKQGYKAGTQYSLEQNQQFADGVRKSLQESLGNLISYISPEFFNK